MKHRKTTQPVTTSEVHGRNAGTRQSGRPVNSPDVQLSHNRKYNMPLTEHRRKHHQTMDGRPNLTPQWTATDTHWMILLQLQMGECRIAETQ